MIDTHDSTTTSLRDTTIPGTTIETTVAETTMIETTMIETTITETTMIETTMVETTVIGTTLASIGISRLIAPGTSGGPLTTRLALQTHLVMRTPRRPLTASFAQIVTETATIINTERTRTDHKTLLRGMGAPEIVPLDPEVPAEGTEKEVPIPTRHPWVLVRTHKGSRLTAGVTEEEAGQIDRP